MKPAYRILHRGKDEWRPQRRTWFGWRSLMHWVKLEPHSPKSYLRPDYASRAEARGAIIADRRLRRARAAKRRQKWHVTDEYPPRRIGGDR